MQTTTKKKKQKGKRRRTCRVIKVSGNPEWWSLSTNISRSPDSIRLGTWEQEQLKHDKRIL